MRVIRKTIGALSVAVGADEVLAWCPMPTGASLESITGSIHIVGSENRAIATFGAYGVSAYVIPVVDPTSALALKTTWDTMVRKQITAAVNVSSGTIDYEWDIPDTNELIQPGRMDVGQVANMGDEKQKEIIPPRLEMMSFAKRPIGFVAGTPDAWQPIDYNRFRSRRRATAEEPSYAMLAISNPAMTEVQTSPTTDGTVARWGLGMHLKQLLDDFWRLQVGLVESGAETPYSESVTYIQDLVSPDMLDEASTLYYADAITAMVEATWVMRFPDGDNMKSIG